MTGVDPFGPGTFGPGPWALRSDGPPFDGDRRDEPGAERFGPGPMLATAEAFAPPRGPAVGEGRSGPSLDPAALHPGAHGAPSPGPRTATTAPPQASALDPRTDAPAAVAPAVDAPAVEAPHPPPDARARSGYRMRVVCADAAAVVGATAVGVAVESLAGRASSAPVLWGAAALLVAVSLLALSRFRTRDHRVASGAAEYRRTAVALGAALGLAAFALLVAVPAPPRMLLATAAPLLLAGVLGGRRAVRGWFGRVHGGTARSSVVLVGDRAGLDDAVRRLHGSGGVYRVVGVVLDDGERTAAEERGHERAGELVDGERPSELRIDGGPRELVLGGATVPVCGTLASIRASAAAAGADAVLVVGASRARDGFVRSLAWELEGSGIELALVDRLDGIAAARTRLQRLDGLPVLHVDVARHRGAHHRVKRVVDVLLVLLLLVALAPLFAVIALWVRTDGGRVMYRQERVGRDGQRFTMYKFRSMVPDADRRLPELRSQNEGAGALFKIKDDPRVTEVGRFLRRHSLDELPQLWNVLRGEMSLVGPRPPLPSEVETYSETVRRRLLVRPGLTGLWQISGRSDLDWEESVALDLFYVENWSLAHDVRIIARTAGVVLAPHGAY